MNPPENIDGKTVGEWAGAVGTVGALVVGSFAWAWGKARAVARMEKRLEECITVVEGDERWMKRSECAAHHDAVLREIQIRFDAMDQRLVDLLGPHAAKRRNDDSGSDFSAVRHP